MELALRRRRTQKSSWERISINESLTHNEQIEEHACTSSSLSSQAASWRELIFEIYVLKAEVVFHLLSPRRRVVVIVMEETVVEENV